MKRFLWVLIPLAILLGSLPWLLRPEAPPSPVGVQALPTAPPPPPSLEPAVAPAPEPPRPPPPPPPKSVYSRIIEAFRADDMKTLRALRDELLAGSTPAPVPDEENGALAYLAAFTKITPGYYGAFVLRAIQKDRVTASDVNTLRDLVSRNGEAIAALKAAAALEHCRYSMDYDQGYPLELPYVDTIRSAIDLLAAEAFVLEQDGKDSAPTRVALGRLGDSLRDEPYFGAQRRRCQALAWSGSGDPSAVRASLASCVRYELATLLIQGTKGGSRFLKAPETRFEEHVAAAEQAAALVLRPWHESKEALLELERSARPDENYVGTRMDFLPDLVKVTQWAAWAEASLGPAIDPFSGKPMVSRNGLTFSIGPNGVDDGGALDDIVIRR